MDSENQYSIINKKGLTEEANNESSNYLKTLKIYLPQCTFSQIEPLLNLDELGDSVSLAPPKADWQTEFCESVGSNSKQLPWTQLRLAQFNIDEKVQTACCCDPVMMQLTHRGAYMMGPSGLNLTQNDAIRIVAQINEKLMAAGESIYLIDKHGWLYTSEKSLALNSPSINELIGKDVYNFKYGGNDAQYWQQLAMEIQMLIKQMVDYQGLIAPPVETMLNVHFFDPQQINDLPHLPFIQNSSLTVVSDNDLIKSYCVKSMLNFQQFHPELDLETENMILVAFDNEKETYPQIIQFWCDALLANTLKNCQLICGDVVLSLKQKQSWIKRVKEAWTK